MRCSEGSLAPCSPSVARARRLKSIVGNDELLVVRRSVAVFTPMLAVDGGLNATVTSVVVPDESVLGSVGLLTTVNIEASLPTMLMPVMLNDDPVVFFT